MVGVLVLLGRQHAEAGLDPARVVPADDVTEQGVLGLSAATQPAARSPQPDELIAFAKNNLQPRGLTARFGGRIALTDGTIHQQDSPTRGPHPTPGCGD